MSDETKTEDPRQRALRRIRRLLKELAQLAENASLTGAPGKAGAEDAVRAYNALRERAIGLEVDVDDLLAPLPDDAGFDRLGVAARLLRAAIDDEMTGKECERDVRVLVGEARRLEELGRVQDIGSVLREHLPDFLKGEGRGERRVEVFVETRDEPEV